MSRSKVSDSSVKHSVIAIAAAMMVQGAFAQARDAGIDRLPSELTGSPVVAPPNFVSFSERLASPVREIRLIASAERPPADGVTATTVRIELVGRDGQRLSKDQDVTIELSGGARLLLPKRRTLETGADAGDTNRAEPQTQLKVSAGLAEVRVIAPSTPADVIVRVTAAGQSHYITLRYQPDLREMIAVGLLEGRVRQDRFDPNQIVPARENDGFEEQLKGFNKEFAGGRGNAGARAALYLKGKVKGEYLLTVNYDSDKQTRTRLFNEIDPNAFYPVYGDSSLRGNDAQSATKLYLRLDKGRSFLLVGDLSTNDPNPARALSQFNRSLPGLQGRYSEGITTANVFAARESLRQVVDEFPGRGVSGPYSVSSPNGVVGSERVELVVRSRFQPSLILKTTALTRSVDYEFEPFSGRILFRSPVPSVDDQLNPISIRVTYEIEQGGERHTIAGGDVRLQLSDSLAVGAAVARDSNPNAPVQVAGVNAELKLSKTTSLIAEYARSQVTANTDAAGADTRLSSNFAGRTGEFSGGATRIEIRHADDALRARLHAVRADRDFHNPSSGAIGGRTDAGAELAWKATDRVTVNAELQSSSDSVLGTDSKSGAVGVELKLSDQLSIGGGVRRVVQNAASLAQSSTIACNNSTVTGTYGGSIIGYNTGFGINPAGSQSIDPVTGRPLACATAINDAVANAADVDRTQAYAKLALKLTPRLDVEGELSRISGTDEANTLRIGGRWKATDRIGLFGDVQRAFSGNDATTAKLGADWQIWDQTRVFARLERSQRYSGQYGLGTGPIETGLSVGIDTQYMRDGSVFSEYRLRDTGSGRDVQQAIGLRNTWNLAEGLKLLTNAERLNAKTGDTTALGAGIEYTASKLWKSSGRIEWREDDNNRNWLLTAAGALKLSRDWSLLARYYLNLVQPQSNVAVSPAPGSTPANGVGLATSRQSRFQTGFAYRPVDFNNLDVLAFYENRDENTRASGIDRNVDIISIRTNYHPSRPWWISGRYALKRVDELLEGAVRDSYTAQLFGGRVMYDITNRWTIGGNITMLQGSNSSRQFAYGLEVGYIVMDNLLFTLGYNWRGFNDRDLSASEYTNRGWVFGVRYKFDENLFKSNDPSVNSTLSPSAEKAKP